MDQSAWCTIENDPGVFTELIKLLGVKGVEMQEIVDLENPDYVKTLNPIYGFIFLFKWKPEKDQRKHETDYPKDLFFAKQVIQDACATQAILGILLNIESQKVKIGDTLTEFKQVAGLLNPEEKGEIIGEHEIIRKVHNSFSEPEMYVVDERDKSSNEKGDAFHFISYVPFKGIVYEIDGLKQGPFKICEYQTEDEMIEKILPIIKKRTETYTQDDPFSFMAMIHDQNELYLEQIENLKKIEPKNESEKSQIHNEIQELNYKIKFHQEDRKRTENENIRRRHSYIPFLVNLLKVLAEKNELKPLVEQAKKK